jgi:hypothetical protein
MDVMPAEMTKYRNDVIILSRAPLTGFQFVIAAEPTMGNLLYLQRSYEESILTDVDVPTSRCMKVSSWSQIMSEIDKRKDK